MSQSPRRADHPVFAELWRQSHLAPVVVAHRGDRDNYPENTLAAFRAGLDAGATVVEFDYRESREGIPYCLHDATFDRTTDSVDRGHADLPIAATAVELLVSFDAGAWKGAAHRGAAIPSLEQALAEIAPRGLPMIEHKAGQPERLVALLERLGLTERVLVQSFDWDFVAAVHALRPTIATGVLGEGELSTERLADLPRTGAGLLHWHVPDLRAADVQRAHAAGLLVCVYTANEDRYADCLAMDVDMITTDTPRRLAELVRCGAMRRTGSRDQR